MNFKSNFYANTFTDLLFNILVGIVFLFILALLLINPIAKDATVKKKAEWIIEMTWPKENDCDMDLWVMDPDGNIVSFKKKSVGLMHIERDDLGRTTDVFFDKNGIKHFADENGEVWTLRGQMKGEFVVNVHVYSCRTPDKGVQLKDGTFISQFKKVGEGIDVPVSVRVIRINPSYMIFKTVIKNMKSVWDEQTFMILDIDEKSATFVGDDYVKLVDVEK